VNGLLYGIGAVSAYVENTSVNATGAASVSATSSETITALVASGAAALEGAGVAAVSVSFAGAFAANEIQVATHAYVDGGGSATITTNGLSVSAMDTAQINAGGNGMPAYADMLSADDKANIMAYLHTL